MAGESAFRVNYERYDNWFEKNEESYFLELEAVKRFIPKSENGLEIGVGTGKFAGPLNIKFGCDPVFEMFARAKDLGINVLCAKGENLPFKTNSFDYCLCVTSICFFDDILASFKEARRVIKESGFFILGFVDKVSWLGDIYLEKKNLNPFYKDAFFYSCREVLDLLDMVGFKNIKTCQTLFENGEKKIKDGFGLGGFTVVKGQS